MADIKTLKDNKTQVLPRTTLAAVMNDNGEPIENDISSISVPVESTANTLNTVNGTPADNVTQSLTELQNIKNDLKAAINGSGNTVGDIFVNYSTAVADGRAGIASAITEKGVQTPSDAPFDILEANVRAIKTGVETVSGKFLGSMTDFYYFDGDSAQSVGGSPFESRDVAKGSVVFITRDENSPASFVCSGGNLLFEFDKTGMTDGFIRVVEVTENNFSIGFL
ncbi:hypothetical protein B5G34_00850 [Flavonifractor sp. An82]|uniref:hypothetical protein n=1 Tax=Flavonifractor sp. An82 TaxID=1965660 RepID=UPI000B398B08|nr:hypothetical protein [Flavonifractor sp. An82]OUN23676.1 hypothetical protein B5G34_00850 [Flavonifractor sp. An82]